MIQFRALGALDLRRADGQEIRAVLAQPKRVALLTYLALARPRGFHQRDELLPLFWPDASDERARAALSRAIYFLRRELGEDVIINRGDEIAINRERMWCDASVFEAHCEAGEGREALAIYRGDLLPGFFTSGGNGFEEWLEHERTRLRDLASRTAWELSDKESRANSPQVAVSWAQRAVELAPFQEPGIRRLLLLLEDAGDRPAAIIAYEKFAHRLQSELELTPTPATLDVIAAIRRRNQPINPLTVGGTSASSGAEPLLLPASAERAGRNRSKRALVAAMVATVIIIATPAVLLARAKRYARTRDNIAVAEFVNRTEKGELDALARFASKRIVASLTTTGVLHVMSTPATPNSAQLASDGAGRVRMVARRGEIDRRAGIVVTGEVQQASGAFLVLASIFDVSAGRVLWTIPRTVVALDSVRAAIDEISDRVTGAVATLVSPRFTSWFPKASSPPTFPAFQEFAQGVELQMRGAHADAMVPLRRAVALDSTFILAQLQLATAHVNTYEHAADSIAVALNARRSLLTPLQRHWLDYLLSLGDEDWAGGYRALAAGAHIAPEAFLQLLAESAWRLNRPAEAREHLERLATYGQAHLGTEYWKLLTRTHHSLGDHGRELTAARRARAMYPDRLELVELELVALAAQGNLDNVRTLLDTALVFPGAKTAVPTVVIDMPGLGLWPGRLMVAAATELRAHGYEEAALATFSQAIDWYTTQRMPDDAAETIRKEIAKARYAARQWPEAERAFRALLNDDPSNYAYLGFVGASAARQGDTETAERIIAQFDTLRPTFPRPHAIAGYWQGKISAILGNEAQAMRGFIECFGPQGRSGVHAEFDFERYWGTPTFKAFTRPKG